MVTSCYQFVITNTIFWCTLLWQRYNNVYNLPDLYRNNLGFHLMILFTSKTVVYPILFGTLSEVFMYYCWEFNVSVLSSSKDIITIFHVGNLIYYHRWSLYLNLIHLHIAPLIPLSSVQHRTLELTYLPTHHSLGHYYPLYPSHWDPNISHISLVSQ